MKGTLHKTEQGWMVATAFITTPPSGTTFLSGKELPLHPDSIESFNIWDGKEVEFEIVEVVSEKAGDNMWVNSYAKLINVDKLGNEDVSKLGYDEKGRPLTYWGGKQVPEMVEDDVKDWAHLTSVSKGLDGSVYQSNYEDGFTDGYNKAKETLYTEEQVREAYMYGRSMMSPKNFEKYIQSLKQPKQ